MRELLEQFKAASKQRKRYRREIMKTMRQYKNLFHNDSWILHKMDNNYMKDLTDNRLIDYLNFIIENRKR